MHFRNEDLEIQQKKYWIVDNNISSEYENNPVKTTSEKLQINMRSVKGLILQSNTIPNRKKYWIVLTWTPKAIYK